MSLAYPLPEFAYLHGKPASTALVKQQFADFRVDEVLPFEFSGDGEHMLVHIEKENANTPWVAKQLAKACEVPAKQVSFAGMKDRHGITRQWFSIQLPGKANVELATELAEGVRVLDIQRHNRKLKRGALSGNHFQITLRELSSPEQVAERLELIKQSGVPNYFGEQRFGREGANVTHALAMFGGKRIRDRDKRSIYLSAARSLLFNLVISQRIQQGAFSQALEGDVFKFAVNNAFFESESLDDSLLARFAEGEIELTAPLIGRGELGSHAAAQALESAVIEQYPEISKGLSSAGLNMERRALCLKPENFEYRLKGNYLELRFFLKSGCFATSVLRELAAYQEAL